MRQEPKLPILKKRTNAASSLEQIKENGIRSDGFGPHIGVIAAKEFFHIFSKELMQWATGRTASNKKADVPKRKESSGKKKRTLKKK